MVSLSHEFTTNLVDIDFLKEVEMIHLAFKGSRMSIKFCRHVWTNVDVIYRLNIHLTRDNAIYPVEKASKLIKESIKYFF